jgi:hypothetical protein
MCRRRARRQTRELGDREPSPAHHLPPVAGMANNCGMKYFMALTMPELRDKLCTWDARVAGADGSLFGHIAITGRKSNVTPYDQR